MGAATILIVGASEAGPVPFAAGVAAAGYAVTVTGTADAPARVRHLHPDAVVLDATRLSLDVAVAQVRGVRAATAAPLLAIVASHDERGGPALLDAGADDFLRYPAAAMELRARLRAHLRPR